MAFGATAMHRRLLWFPVPQQAIQVLPLFVVATLLALVARLLASFPELMALMGTDAATVRDLWPVVTVLLLAPQRRAPNPDDNRPL